MKNNAAQQLRQYARVARVFPKTALNALNARIRVLSTNNSQK